MPERFHITIPDGDGGMALRVTRTFAGMPVKFTLVSSGTERGLHWSRYCAEHVTPEEPGDAALIELLCGLSSRDVPNILLPIMTPAFRFVAANRAALSQHFLIPPIASIESLETASDKRRLYEFCLANDLPVLPSTPLADYSGSTFPVLVKTRDAQGGEGFVRIESSEALERFTAELGERELARRFVQPLIDGYDVSLAAYCEGGEIRCHTMWRALSYGRETYAMPECIQFIENDPILALARDLLRKLNWEGVCDIDFFVDRRSGEAWLLEVNARFFGSGPACALAGINFTQIMCERAQSREERAWPKQRPEVFCETKALPAALLLPGIGAKLLRHPIRRLSLGIFLRDPGPDLYNWYLRLRRWVGEASLLHLAGAVFLCAQLTSVLVAPFIAERFFCWAPYDEHTHYAIHVRVDGRSLSADEVAARYRYPQSVWEPRDIDNVISILRQYEQTYGKDDGAEVVMTYRTNGHDQRTWTWPQR